MTSQLINYGERPPYWKSSIGCISTTDCPINANFGTKKQNHVHTHTKRSHDQNTKILKFKMADGHHFENVLALYLSRKSSDLDEIWWPDANFGSKNGHMRKYQNLANLKWRTAAILKIVLAIFQGVIVRLIRNLVRRSRITLGHRSVPKIPKFENSRWRTAAILKMVLSLHLGLGSSEFDENLICRCKFWFWLQEWSRDKN